MKKFVFIILFIVLSSTVILYGNAKYNNKLSQTNQQAQADLKTHEAELEKQESKLKIEEQERLEKLLGNLTSELEGNVRHALDAGEPLKVVAMGSRALTGIGDTIPWPEILEERVNKKYGKNLFDVQTLAFGEDNTFEVVGNDKHLEAAMLKPDILILEPFIWNDNGYARIEDTLYHIGVMVSAAEQENEDVVIFIQPPNPTYNATFFRKQVERVKEYSLENGLLYFDHWEAWPDTDDELIKSYIKEDDYIPNQAGHELWAEYIVNYFVAE